MPVAFLPNQAFPNVLSSSSRPDPVQPTEKSWMNPTLAETHLLYAMFRRCPILGPSQRRQGGR